LLLKDFAKTDGGMTAIAKHIITKGGTAVTEHEYSAAVSRCGRSPLSVTGAFQQDQHLPCLL
jgi:hypothetical protein